MGSRIETQTEGVEMNVNWYATQARRITSLTRSRYVRASMYYLGERFATSVIGIVVFAIVARKYTPGDLGILSFTLAVIQIAAPSIASGAEPIVMRELVARRTERGNVLGSAAVVIGVTTLIAIAVPFAYLVATHSDDHRVMTVAVLAGLASLPGFFLVLEHLLKADALAYATTTARVVATACGAVTRIAVVLSGLSIEYIAAALLVEAVIQIVVLLALSRNHPDFRGRWSVSASEIKLLTGVCLPAILSSLVVTIFFRVNYFFVEGESTSTQLGYYAFAFNIMIILSALPALALNGIYPRLIELERSNPARFEALIGWLFFLASAFGYIASVAITIAGPFIIPIIFGRKYLPAFPALLVMFLTLVAVTSGSVRAILINIQRRPHLHLWSSLVGILVLVPVSMSLVPAYGAVGAALGIMAGAVASAVATTLVFPSLRPYAKHQIAGLMLLTPLLLREKRLPMATNGAP